jgi:hypothetical protein
MAMAVVTSVSNWLGGKGKRSQWKRKNRVRGVKSEHGRKCFKDGQTLSHNTIQMKTQISTSETQHLILVGV